MHTIPLNIGIFVFLAKVKITSCNVFFLIQLPQAFFSTFLRKLKRKKTQAPNKLKLFYFKTQAFCIKTQCTRGFFAKFSVNTIAVFWKMKKKNSKLGKFFGQNSHFFL